MTLRSLKSFEQRWAKLRRLATAQLKDFERDRKALAKLIRRYKVKKDLIRARDAVTHSKRLERAIKGTRKFVATKDKVVRQARRRGRLLKRALT